MWQKKLLLWTGVSFFAAMMGLTTVASAQTTLDVQAEVLEAITVNGKAPLNFGSFVPATGGDIIVSSDPATATTSTGPVLFNTDARGLVDVLGTSGRPVLVTVTVMTQPTDGATTMTLGNLTCGSDDDATSHGAAPCSFNMPVAGTTQVGIGGTLTVSASPTHAVGNYTGVVAVTAAYN